jgi:hypothetical protein
MEGGPTQREISERASDRIRETTKWLIGTYAAVGAALIAGSQLSNIGRLPLCIHAAGDCARLWVAIAGIIVSLFGVVFAIHAGVRVLVSQRLPTSALQQEWERGPASGIYRFFFENPVFLQGFADFADMDAKETEALAEYDSLEQALSEAQPEAQAQLREKLKACEDKTKEILRRSDAVVSLANQVALADLFSRTTRRLLLGAMLAAFGIGLFAWAANPPVPRNRLSAELGRPISHDRRPPSTVVASVGVPLQCPFLGGVT